jgi:hypothetical protein
MLQPIMFQCVGFRSLTGLSCIITHMYTYIRPYIYPLLPTCAKLELRWTLRKVTIALIRGMSVHQARLSREGYRAVALAEFLRTTKLISE